jgi:MFS family permease
MPTTPKGSGDVGSGSSEEPRSRFLPAIHNLGLRWARLIITDLRNVPEEQILSNPLYGQLLALVVFGIGIFGIGCYGGIYALTVTSRSSWWTIVFGVLAVFGLVMLIIALVGLAIALKVARRLESERTAETLQQAGYQEQRLRAVAHRGDAERQD